MNSKRAINKLALKPNYKVLDIACGTGLNFKHIEKAIGKKGKIIAVDYVDEMLKAAEKTRKRLKNIQIIQADASNCKFKP